MYPIHSIPPIRHRLVFCQHCLLAFGVDTLKAERSPFGRSSFTANYARYYGQIPMSLSA